MRLIPKDLYLIAYNNLCCAGWATVLALALPSVLKTVVTSPFSIGNALCNVYSTEELSVMLLWVQTAALLEIVHAGFGLVRSSVFVTTLQVGSRIAALYAVRNSPMAQQQFGAGLMILSWALVEVPRYSFYVAALVTGDATKKTPYPLFWLRYSLFAILYPTGIIGELTVFLTAAKDPAFRNQYGEQYSTFMFWFILFFPMVYLPGALPMIFNMAANRKSAFKKRFAKPSPPPRGLVWPEDEKGVRSSTPVAKAILSAAVGAINADKAREVTKEKNWRFGYVRHIVGLVEEQCRSPENALAIAEAGLKKAYDTFRFVYPDGSSVSLAEAMDAKQSNDKFFFTGHIKGDAPASTTKTLEVPYKGKILSGEALKDQVQKWVEYGTIEQSAGDAIQKCVDNPSWLDLSDRYFVLLGAGSAMGPYLVLMALGANVIAIDLDRPNIWKRLLSIAKKSSGSITFPMSLEQKSCKDEDAVYAASGCNLFTQTPMIRDWLLEIYPTADFVVGSYAYLDGALHVQVSLAMDAICKDLSTKRKASLAYLCTPTDLHLVPKDVHDASEAEHKRYSKKLYCFLLHTLSGGKLLRKNARKPVLGVGGYYYMVNGLSVAQGPNYALAKRMQHWRAIIARNNNNNNGCIVSSNVAPATSTVSVVHNRTFAWAYEGMPYFKPYEIFAPETSNAVMSAILIYDLCDHESVGNPKQTELINPNELFKYGSFNGGAWRCAYEVDSIGEASVLIFFARTATPYLVALAVAGIGIGAKSLGYL